LDCKALNSAGATSSIGSRQRKTKFDPKVAAHLRDMAGRLESMRALDAKLGLRSTKLSLSKGGTRGVPDHIRPIEAGASWSNRQDHEQALAYVLEARKGFLETYAILEV
jgi:hypothetical protein